jgi:hypothetical protein
MADEVYSIIFDVKAPLSKGAPGRMPGKGKIPKVASGVKGGGSMARLTPRNQIDLGGDDFSTSGADIKMPTVNLPASPQMASKGGGSNSSSGGNEGGTSILGRVAPQREQSASPKAEPLVRNTDIKSNDAPLPSANAPQMSADGSGQVTPGEGAESNGGTAQATSSGPTEQKNVSGTSGTTPTSYSPPAKSEEAPIEEPQVEESKATEAPKTEETKAPEIPKALPPTPTKNPKGTINGVPWVKDKATEIKPYKHEDAAGNTKGFINGEKVEKTTQPKLYNSKNAPGTINGEAPTRGEPTQIEKPYKNPKGTINGAPAEYRGPKTEIPKANKEWKMEYEFVPPKVKSEEEKKKEEEKKIEEQDIKIKEYRELQRNRPTLEEIRNL